MKVLCNCGEYHDFEEEECSMCIPPKEVLVFGHYHIDLTYREELYTEYPYYNVEEIVGTFMGENHNFPSYNEWISKRMYEEELEEEEQMMEEEHSIRAWSTSGSDDEDSE
jgi:hypothetical protein